MAKKKSKVLAWMAASAALLAALGAFVPVIIHFLPDEDTPSIPSQPGKGESGTVRYRLDVINGRGGGQYAPGSVVAIVAEQTRRGMEFKGWTAPATVRISDQTAASTTLTMPETDVSVAARFEAATQSVRLTPDRGEPPRSGTVRNTGQVAGNPITLGDDGRSKSLRAFVTFDLSALPARAEIHRADLIMRRGGGNGHPVDADPGASGFFGRFVVESVTIGAKLEAADYSRAGLSLGEHATSLLQENWNTTRPVDVRTAIQSVLRTGGKAITFRLRFLTDGDNDDTVDNIFLDDRGDRLRLEVDYTG